MISVIIVIIVALIAIIDIPRIVRNVTYKKEYSKYVEKYSEEYNVDENLIYAVIKSESNFDSNAISSKNAIGLMQLMEDTALEICERIDLKIEDEEIEEKLLEPEININIGTKYLSTLLQRYKNVELSIAAYNAGIGTVNNWVKKGTIQADGSDIENIPYKETNNYVRKILRDYKIYNDL